MAIILLVECYCYGFYFDENDLETNITIQKGTYHMMQTETHLDSPQLLTLSACGCMHTPPYPGHVVIVGGHDDREVCKVVRSGFCVWSHTHIWKDETQQYVLKLYAVLGVCMFLFCLSGNQWIIIISVMCSG